MHKDSRCIQLYHESLRVLPETEAETENIGYRMRGLRGPKASVGTKSGGRNARLW